MAAATVGEPLVSRNKVGAFILCKNDAMSPGGMAVDQRATTPTAFVSYAREDSVFSLKLGNDLKRAGANVWIDQIDIEPGQEWDSAIEEAVEKSPWMLVILSPASVASKNVRDEISFALKKEKRIIPVLYQACSVPFRLDRIQHVDFRSDYAQGLTRLLNTLGVVAPISASEIARPPDGTDQRTREPQSGIKEEREPPVERKPPKQQPIQSVKPGQSEEGKERATQQAPTQKKTLGTIFEKGKNIVVTWFSVLARGPNAFEKVDLQDSSTLIYALRFMFFMALVSLAIDLPLVAKIGGSFLAASSIPCALVIEAYLEYLITGLILYGSIKLVGGKGGLQASIAAYCFLTAYLPLMSFFMLPVRRLTIPAISQGSNYTNAVSKLFEEASHLSTWDLSSLVLSFLLTTVVLVLFFRAVFNIFRAIHQLSRARALLGFVGGLIGWAVIMSMFLEPALSATLRALAR